MQQAKDKTLRARLRLSALKACTRRGEEMWKSIKPISTFPRPPAAAAIFILIPQQKGPPKATPPSRSFRLIFRLEKTARLDGRGYGLAPPRVEREPVCHLGHFAADAIEHGIVIAILEGISDPAAMLRISASFMPRVVKAGVPTRMPEGFSGGLVSKGMEFLFTVMPALPKASSASDPRMPLGRHRPASDDCQCRRKRCGSRPLASLRRAALALVTIAPSKCGTRGAAPQPSATALAATMCTSGPPCWPGNTALSMAVARSCVEIIKPARGPRRVLCVVVVVICAWGTGEGCTPPATGQRCAPCRRYRLRPLCLQSGAYARSPTGADRRWLRR